jgi:23S rRNA G2069 N7-methylase RlmK/C1962 C5-methylase RlmI
MFAVLLHIQSSSAFQGQRIAQRAPLWRLLSSASSVTVKDADDSTTTTDATDADTTTSVSTHKKSAFPSVILKRSKQSMAFRNGNPLVFTRAIQSVQGSPARAALVEVLVEADNSNKGTIAKQPLMSLGFGIFNPDSLYRVRILCHRYLQPQLYKQIASSSQQEQQAALLSQQDDALQRILSHHIDMARRKRMAINLPNEHTNTYRLVHGEGDGLSGLAIDIVGNTVAVVMSSAAWCQTHKKSILKTIQAMLPPEYDIVWKTTPTRLQQDGYSMDSMEAADDDNASRQDAVLCLENGVQYQVHPYAAGGQKTSFYCDQRENRARLAKLVDNKRVLDLCCYHGGFGLNAIVHGKASSVTMVDSSADAMATCQTNAKLNQCTDKVQLIQSDITVFMQTAFTNGDEYDVVVLDPPKLAPSEKLLDKARRKYHGINRDAIKLISKEHGGTLLTCTCSAAMAQKDGGQYFLSMVHGAALAAGRQVTLLRVTGAAACHTQSPVAWPAGAYLSAALFFVHPMEV